MPDIKSAKEIAAEKIARLGEVTEEERLNWKYTPEGEKLAAKCLKETCNLTSELEQFDEKARKFVETGAVEVLIRNITLPKNEAARKNTKKAMDSLKLIKKDKVAVENVFSNLRRLFDHYVGQGEQQRKRAYEQLKQEFDAKIQQAAQQQMGSRGGRVNIDVESQPQFREEWRKLQAQLDAQYNKILDEAKQDLLHIK